MRRSSGELPRTEDVSSIIFHSGTYRVEDLSADTKEILSRIYEFGGFAPFLPANILEDAGKVEVILDEEEIRKVPVTLKQLEDERDSLKAEVERLKKLVEELLKSPKVDQSEIEKIQKKIRKLEDKIKAIDDIIRKIKAAGNNSIELEVELLGYYVRKKAEIHLMMGTIERMYRSKGLVPKITAIVFVHELMHAYFDVRDPYIEHPHCRSLEESIAEYGMLCFMEMFERYYSGCAGILNTAKEMVEEKKYSLGVCDYGFGSYLFDDKSSFGVDWVSLFHSTCTSLLMNAPEVLDYEEMISPIRYPRNERSCECKLFEALKPRRFSFREVKSVWDKNGEKELYFTITAAVANRITFKVEYPRGTKVHITFHNKTSTKHFNGEATIVLNNTRFYIKDDLLEDYAKVFGKTDHRPFAFYEEKPSDGIHPAEWVAIEL